jgi:hypothetical protein
VSKYLELNGGPFKIVPVIMLSAYVSPWHISIDANKNTYLWSGMQWKGEHVGLLLPYLYVANFRSYPIK